MARRRGGRVLGALVLLGLAGACQAMEPCPAGTKLYHSPLVALLILGVPAGLFFWVGNALERSVTGVGLKFLTWLVTLFLWGMVALFLFGFYAMLAPCERAT